MRPPNKSRVLSYSRHFVADSDDKLSQGKEDTKAQNFMFRSLNVTPSTESGCVAWTAVIGYGGNACSKLEEMESYFDLLMLEVLLFFLPAETSYPVVRQLLCNWPVGSLRYISPALLTKSNKGKIISSLSLSLPLYLYL